MAHQITDEKQEYQYAGGFTTPAGHHFNWYDTKENERLTITHASGSHIEFKADGSVFIKSLKDLHTHSSIVSSASDGTPGSSKGAELTSKQIGTDYTIDIQGVLKVKARQIHIEGHDTVHVLAGTDLEMKASNTWIRAKEQIDIEGTSSIRMDTDECTQAFRTLRTDVGTEEGEEGKKGGLYKLKVHGTTIMEQSDETAALTLRSKGYANYVCGQERVDLVGKYEERPSTIAQEGMATWTQKVVKPEKMDQNAVSKVKPGDMYLSTDAGITLKHDQKDEGSSLNPEHGRYVDIPKGKDEEFMGDGDKILTIAKGDHEHTQAKGDKKKLVNGNEQDTNTGAYDEVRGNGKKEVIGNSKLEKICKGMSGGGAGASAFYNDTGVVVDDSGNIDLDCSIYACPIPPIPDSVPPLPNILPEDDSAQGSNGGGDSGGGGGGGGGGMPSLPIGTLLQLLCGNFMNKASKLNLQNAQFIFLN